MDVSQHRQDLHIHFLGPASSQFSQLQEFAHKRGHPVKSSTSESDFFQIYRATPSHIVLVNLQSLENDLESFIEKCAEVFPKVVFIVMGVRNQRIEAKAYFSYGVIAYIESGDTVLEQFDWEIDQVVDKLVCESIRDDLMAARKDMENRLAKAQANVISIGEPSVVFKTEVAELDVDNIVVNFEQAKSKEQLIEKFISTVSPLINEDGRIIYFKYLGDIISLVATHASNVSADQIQGLGVRLSQEEAKAPKNFLLSPKGFSSLDSLLEKSLGVASYYSRALTVRGEVDGIMIFMGSAIDAARTIEFNNHFTLFRLIYEKQSFLKRMLQLEVKDAVTQFLSAEQFNYRLSEEMDRARRIEEPLSVVKLSIDQLPQINQTLGESVRDAVLKHIAVLVKRSSRVTDVLCRTGENEFSLLLPHSTHKGALLKAERLRRIVEASPVPGASINISISQGVSEFPSLAGDANSVSKGASQALNVAVKMGGNKVGLAKANSSHKPEFRVE